MTNAPDPALLEALAKRNERPHIKQEEDQNEGQKVFHPGAAKAMKLRQATLCDPIEPPKVDLAKVEEAVTLTTEVLGEMQTGALSVADVVAPEFEMDDAMAIDHEAVITEYKEMKGFLQSSNTRQFAPKLYSELPETPVKELDLDGTMVGPNHPAFKACTPDTDVQSSLWRTSPVWWRLEAGLWTLQSTQVGQAAETGGADSPQDPDSPS